MPHSLQRAPAGYVWIAQCACCGKDLRCATNKELIAQWEGIRGCFNGKWEFICNLCLAEARTGEHVVAWRW